ncbi:hypothetical protein SEA_WEASELS2_94 [Rhodococcus phage Weasels2]|uniref:Uncharacterized protein n=1 Tax=Rhodococcus phage Weasels2 TaxID=1897437 RepID=A0A1I9SA77_9CAUD|nr:hypothetical protein FDH04_gp094 [Rhodococcus phage Weasels2]AOZ63683.1 hypothetical protein SEA_WEASELS2_94 [Rhodococcus phage Weasels2]
MAFKKFISKIEEEVEVTDILFHAVDVLDEAITIAIKNQDAGMIDTIYDKYLEASDRLMGIAFASAGQDQEDEENSGPPKKQRIGFYNEPKPNTIKGS